MAFEGGRGKPGNPGFARLVRVLPIDYTGKLRWPMPPIYDIIKGNRDLIRKCHIEGLPLIVVTDSTGRIASRSVGFDPNLRARPDESGRSRLHLQSRKANEVPVIDPIQ